EDVASAVEAAIHTAETELPTDVLTALGRAYEKEQNSAARGEYANIFANLRIAKERDVPICQDTGLVVLYFTLPPEVAFSGELYRAAAEGVRRATLSVPLRPNAVDPLSRENSKTNCGAGMPAVHVVPGDTFSVTVFPKGAGSENMSQIKMMLPSEVSSIPDFVADVVRTAGARPCPPVVVGVGIGGTFDTAAALAKEALLEPIDSMDAFEQEICDKVNALGIGALGLGGGTTALAVKVKRGACHTASLPVAVNIQCWCCRRAERRIGKNNL
ncbi:MAG: fumarate hydratase, partial [Methanocorpusculum sp.]|nr:fumarate hydratase [Methanocorpusculum sp.]